MDFGFMDPEAIVAVPAEQRPRPVDRPLLVILASVPAQQSELAQWRSTTQNLVDSLKTLGLDVVVISNVEGLALADSPSTFRSVYRNDRCNVIADGVPQLNVVWAESTSAIVCFRERPGSLQTSSLSDFK